MALFAGDFLAVAFFVTVLAAVEGRVAAFFALDLTAGDFLAAVFFDVDLAAAEVLAVLFLVAVEAVLAAVVFLAVVLTFLAGFAVTALAVLFAAGAFLAVLLLTGAFLAVAFAVVVFAGLFFGADFFAAEILAADALVAGAFFAVLLVAGAFLAVLFAVLFAAPSVFLAAPLAALETVAVVLFAVVFAAPTALRAGEDEELFLAAVFLAGVVFALDVLADGFFAAAGTCASWSVIARRSRRSLSRTAGPVAPAYDLDHISLLRERNRQKGRVCRIAPVCHQREGARPNRIRIAFVSREFGKSAHDETGICDVNMNLRQSGPFIGMAGMATTLFLYAYSAIAQRDALSLVVLPLTWLVLFVLGVVWFTDHPYRVLALPFVATVVWFAAMLG